MSRAGLLAAFLAAYAVIVTAYAAVAVRDARRITTDAGNCAGVEQTAATAADRLLTAERLADSTDACTRLCILRDVLTRRGVSPDIALRVLH